MCTSHYKKNDLFPSELLAVPEFKKFINKGYYKYLKSMVKDVIGVIKILKHSVTTLDLRIFQQYLQEQVGGSLANHEFSFYQDLNKHTRVSTQSWAKG